MMSVFGAGIPKYRCRTTVAERMVETRAELPFIGDQVGLLKPRPGRPQRGVMLSVPFALVGGVWLMAWMQFNLSVAVAVGFIALAGVAAETGVVMLIYLITR